MEGGNEREEGGTQYMYIWKEKGTRREEEHEMKGERRQRGTEWRVARRKDTKRVSPVSCQPEWAGPRE